MMPTAPSPHSAASCSFNGIYSRYWSRDLAEKEKQHLRFSSRLQKRIYVSECDWLCENANCRSQSSLVLTASLPRVISTPLKCSIWTSSHIKRLSQLLPCPLPTTNPSDSVSTHLTWVTQSIPASGLIYCGRLQSCLLGLSVSTAAGWLVIYLKGSGLDWGLWAHAKVIEATFSEP